MTCSNLKFLEELHHLYVRLQTDHLQVQINDLTQNQQQNSFTLADKCVNKEYLQSHVVALIRSFTKMSSFYYI